MKTKQTDEAKKARQAAVKLIQMQADALREMDEVGRVVDVIDNLRLLDVALDLLEYPTDNTEKYDWDEMNRTGIIPDGLSCRDYIYSVFWIIALDNKDVERFVQAVEGEISGNRILPEGFSGAKELLAHVYAG